VEDWKALGRAVYSARVKAGYRDTARWAATLGRSTRVVLGLERGEPTGRRTLLMVEEALDWPLGWCDLILTGKETGPPTDAPPAFVGPAADADPRPVGDVDLSGLDPADIERVRAYVQGLKDGKST
jgi:hypothetical protein